MHTPGSDPDRGGGGIGAAVKDVTDHAKRLVNLELELAKLEVKRKAAAFAVGIALLVAAAVVGLFGVGFLLATLAAALATFLPTWLALLLVALLLLVVAGALAMVGAKRLQPPVPTQAIEEAKRTTEALRADGARG